MRLVVVPLESKTKWEAFIGSQNPNTFLHSWNWGEFHKSLNCKIYRLGVCKNDKLFAAALFIKIPARRGTFLFCPHGPILRTGENKATLVKLLVKVGKQIAKQEKCSFLRISPVIEQSPENEAFFLKLGFRNAPTHMHPELSWILAITPNEDQLLSKMRKTTRYCIRKAQKQGVNLVKSNDADAVEIFFKMYESTVNRQNFTPFSKEYLKKEFFAFKTENQALWLFAKYKGDIVSGAMLIFYNNMAFYHHGASIQKYPDVPASYLLQWEAIRQAKTRGCRLYNFWGIAPENAPNHPWAGITLFKKGFGGYAQAYVHAKDFILSPRYFITYAIERIRREKRGL